MPATPAATRWDKEGGGGLASKLFEKFDNERKYDPFLDMDPIIQDSKEGMEALLSMCNTVEINSLFGALGFVVPCPRKAKEQQIMKYIRDGGRQVQKKFADVLKFFWEDLLFEYLRTVGCPLRDREHDPRHFVMKYWRRSMLDPSLRPGFVPFYAKREVKKRSNITQEDKDIRDIRAGLIHREGLVKDAEAKTRGQHDYRFVLQYFSASRDLHRTLVANVNYLANEVEQLRANMDHTSESISIMEQQMGEMETKYDRVVGGLVHRGAFHLTLENNLYGMINEGNATLKASEQMANELLGSMDTGPGMYDVETTTLAEDTTTTNNNRFESQDAEVVAASGSSVGSAAVHHKEGDHGLEKRRTPSTSCEDPKKEDEKQKWATPRSGVSSRITSSSGSNNSGRQGGMRSLTQASTGATPATTNKEAVALTPGGGEGAICGSRQDCSRDESGNRHLSLGPCLSQVFETHRRSCRRYANQVAELESRNAVLVARITEAAIREEEAIAQISKWKAKHDELEVQLADVVKRSTEELNSAEDRVNEARSQSLESTNLLREMVEKATPSLIDMVVGFAPQHTEQLGVDLLGSLGVEPDTYSHLLATKRMFEMDLECRAFEIIDGERQIVLAEAAAAAERERDAAAGGKRKKGERGRPRSRGKKAGGTDKGKSGGSKSKSRGKSANGKGTKKAGKSGSSAAKGGRGGAEKKATGKKPSSVDKKRSTSPAKKGGVGSTSPAKKGGVRSTSPANKGGVRSTSPAKKGGVRSTSPAKKGGVGKGSKKKK